MSSLPKRSRRTATKMAGHWAIAAMDDIDERYFHLGDQPPYLTITVSSTDVVRGEYVIGLSTGSLDGALRDFVGETNLSSATRVWTRWTRSRVPAVLT